MEERATSYARHAVGYCDAGQVRVVVERGRANLDHRITVDGAWNDDVVVGPVITGDGER